MKLVLALAAGAAVVASLVVWRTQHGAEVWHRLDETPS